MIKAILFDFDSTLVDYPHGDTLALRKVLERSGLSVSLDEFRDYSGDVLRAIYDNKTILRQNIHAYRLQETMRHFGGTWKDEYLSDYFAVYLNTVKVYDGVNELLVTLKPKYKLGLLTNSNDLPEQKARISASKLSLHLDSIGIAVEIGCFKPNPEAFLWVADKLGVPAAECLFIGDSETYDIVGAQNVGMKTLKKVRDKSDATVADDLFITYSELGDLLNRKYLI